jgi:hypothetical protein
MHSYSVRNVLTLRVPVVVGWLWVVPSVGWAQASPFMTGATALQTNILAWLTPIAIILVMALGAMAMANRMHLKMEQRGLHSSVAERLRAEYRERVRFRLERAAARADDARLSAERLPAGAGASGSPRINDPDETRRRAVQAWLLLRSKEAEKTSGQFHNHEQEGERSARERGTAESERQPQDDLAL